MPAAPAPGPSAGASPEVEAAADRLARVTRGLALSIAAGALLYVGFGAWSGFRAISERLWTFRWLNLLYGLLLATVFNYGLRWLKWEVYLRQLGLRIPPLRSLGIFLSGFALTVTPGKVGELLKAYLLRVSDGVPMARTAPIILAERVTDLVACLILIFAGAAAFGMSDNVILVCSAGGLLVGSLVLPVLFPALGEWLIGVVERLPGLGALSPKLREFHQATLEVLSPAPFLITLALSVLGWAAECACFYLVVHGFDGAGGEPPRASLLLCTFIYALTTVGGALSFLPGGLGVTEGGMVGLLIAAGGAVDRPTASAATILTRLATLWNAVALGAFALLLVQRSLTPRLAAAAAAPPAGKRG